MIKKILILLSIFLLVGCSPLKPNFDSDFKLDTYRCDMSGYKGLTSTNHQFLGVTVKDLEKTINEEGYGAFVLSRVGCDHCQLLMKYINEAAKELGVNVYYIDAESSLYPIVGTDDYDLLDRILKPIEEKTDDGEIELQTPHFFTVVNGEFGYSYIGISFKDNEHPTEKEEKDIINKYKKALEVFVK